MSCDTGNQYLNIFFFRNGSCRKPERIRRRKNEMEKLIAKKGKSCYYHDKIIYTMAGEPVTTLSKFVNNSPFVLVEPEDCFKPAKYSQIFYETLQEMSNNQCQTGSSTSGNFKRKSRSSPSIPPSSRFSSTTCVKFAPVDADDSSEDEFCRESLSCSKRNAPQKSKSDKSLPPQKSTKTKKDGIFANCCVKAQPSEIPSQSFIACGNDKITQTTTDDFKCATERMKRDIQEQKKRAKAYKKGPIQKVGSSAIPPYCPRDGPIDDCEDPKFTREFEAAREQFYKKQNATAKKIKKTLDKKYGIESRHGKC